MTDSQREQVFELFSEINELPSADWDAHLTAIGDEEVKAEVASLLHAQAAGSQLNDAVGNIMRAAVSDGAFDHRTVGPGARFDRYRIQRRIGEGGMGQVYEATRENDFHKRVALKIVRFGLDSDYARSRFQQERQTLAVLEHAYIARLIDGGEAENGCPYLVLEYVEGTPIDGFCRGKKLNEILELFLKVCEAVEYAHRNLIIHRDLKPANILVTPQGDPKLLDFGIAKLLDANVDATQTMMVALTPQYASPEQVLGKPVTTATDVYSLGVVLYQLLTGRTPYRMETGTAFEMERVICQEPPKSPGLRNELDDILLMALRKEPERRYAGVAQLADDVRRFQEGRPVLATPDSQMYRARKYARRHWRALTAIAVAMAGLSIGAGVASYQAHIAKQRLNDVRKLADTFLFDIHDQLVDVAGTTKARAFVVKTAQSYLDKIAQTSESDRELQAELARAFERLADAQGSPHKANLGDVRGAEANYKRSAILFTTLAASDSKQVTNAVQAWGTLGFFYVYQNRQREAGEAFEKAKAFVPQLEKDGSRTALLQLSYLYAQMYDREEQRFDTVAAVDCARRSLAYLERANKLGGDEDAASLSVLSNAHLKLGRGPYSQRDMATALPEYELANQYASRALQLKPDSIRYRLEHINALLNLTTLYGSSALPSLERPAGAGPYARQALPLIEPLLAADAADLSAKMRYLQMLTADARSRIGSDDPNALLQARRAVVLAGDLLQRPNLLNSDRYLVLDAMRELAPLLARLGTRQETHEELTRLIEGRRKLFAGFAPGDDNLWMLVDDIRTAAEIARNEGDGASARKMLAEAVAMSAPFAAAADHQIDAAFFASRLYQTMALFRAAQGTCSEAREWHARDVAVWEFMAPQSVYAAGRLARAKAASDPCSKSSEKSGVMILFRIPSRW